MPAAIEAGFSRSTASKQGKRLLKTAVKREAQKTVDMLKGNTEMTTGELKKTLADIVGMSSTEVFAKLKEIALNERDYNSALKVLKPLARDLGVDLGEEESTNVTVPVLNVTVKDTKPLIEASIEP